MDPNKIMDEILNKARKSNYTLDKCNILLSVPSSTIIRSFKIACILNSTYPEYEDILDDPSRMQSVKEAFKKRLIDSFEKKGIKSGASNLSIKINVEHVESQNDYVELYPQSDHSDFKTKLSNNEKKGNGVEDNEEYTMKSRRSILKTNRLDASLDGYNNITKRLKKIGKDLFGFRCNKSLPHLNQVKSLAKYEINFQFDSIYVSGRYIKYSRIISQTQKPDHEFELESVESFICPTILDFFKGDKYYFSAAGREDIDVRMLGRGRSFLLEIVNPKINIEEENLESIQNLINKNALNKIWINDLQRSSKEDRIYLVEGEIKKSKRYRCLVYFREPLDQHSLSKLNNASDLKLYQKTPIRVLHKRSLKTREKIIYSIHYEYIDCHNAVFEIESQAGTYIKEFVQGDFGRTKPCLAEILGHDEATLTLLDVLEVKLNWPKKLEERLEYPQPIHILEEYNLLLKTGSYY